MLIIILINKDMHTLCSKPFLVNSIGCPKRAQLENRLKTIGLTNVRFMDFNNLDSIIERIISDLGSSFVPHSAIKSFKENSLIKTFSIPKQSSTTKTFFTGTRIP